MYDFILHHLLVNRNCYVCSHLVGSSAGLLMISESLISGSLSKSMGPSLGHPDEQQYVGNRKRHMSAEDHLRTKVRSNSLFADWRHRHFNGDEKGNQFSELMLKEDKILRNQDKNDICLGTSEMKEISEEIKDSGVDLDENHEVGNMCTEVFDVENSEILLENDERMVSLDASNESEDGLCEDRLESITEATSRAGSLRSVTSSPLHVTATPVTENDPLGLFVESQQQVALSGNIQPKSSPEKIRDKFVETKPFANEVKLRKDLAKLDLGKCNIEDTCSNNSNRVGNSNGKTVNKIMSPVEKVQRGFFKIERTSSFPENIGGSSGQTGSDKRKTDAYNTDVASLGRSSSSLCEQRSEILAGTPKSDFRLFRTGSFRRHKENFSGMLKFATGAVANKLTEIKLSMTPSKLGSNSSLTPSYDDIDSEDDRDVARKRGSLDVLHRSIDRLDTSSINGVQGMYWLGFYFLFPAP